MWWRVRSTQPGHRNGRGYQELGKPWWRVNERGGDTTAAGRTKNSHDGDDNRAPM